MLLLYVCSCLFIAQIVMRMILLNDGVPDKEIPDDKDITAAFAIADTDKSGECSEMMYKVFNP